MPGSTEVRLLWWLKFPLLGIYMAAIFSATLGLSSSNHTEHLLISRGEINPVSAKFETVPDEYMPGSLNLSVLVKDPFHIWDNDTMSLTNTRYLPGLGLAGLPLANGCVHSLLLVGSLLPLIVIFSIWAIVDKKLVTWALLPLLLDHSSA
jgi:hypothetical protein